MWFSTKDLVLTSEVRQIQRGCEVTQHRHCLLADWLPDISMQVARKLITLNSGKRASMCVFHEQATAVLHAAGVSISGAKGSPCWGLGGVGVMPGVGQVFTPRL